MNPKTLLLCFVLIPVALFAVLMVIYYMLQKRNRGNKSAVLEKMMNEASSSSSGKDAFYQKVYIKIERIPVINRYLRKIRRRLELVNQNDEYTIRRDTAKITLRAILIALFAAILIAWINKDNLFILDILIPIK